MPHVPHAVAGQVAGVSVAVVADAEVATVVLSGYAELLTADECQRAADLFLEAGKMLLATRASPGG